MNRTVLQDQQYEDVAGVLCQLGLRKSVCGKTLLAGETDIRSLSGFMLPTIDPLPLVNFKGG